MFTSVLFRSTVLDFVYASRVYCTILYCTVVIIFFLSRSNFRPVLSTLHYTQHTHTCTILLGPCMVFQHLCFRSFINPWVIFFCRHHGTTSRSKVMEKGEMRSERCCDLHDTGWKNHEIPEMNTCTETATPESGPSLRTRSTARPTTCGRTQRFIHKSTSIYIVKKFNHR